MRLPNGYGGVVKLSGARRRPYAARITTGWYYNDQTGKRVQRYQILGYAATRAEALQILAHFNDYPIDGASLKLTFADIYERYYQTILMLIYNGVRVSELLDLKKENVHLEERYFDVVGSILKRQHRFSVGIKSITKYNQLSSPHGIFLCIFRCCLLCGTGYLPH